MKERKIELTKTEYDMLVYFMENYNMVLSRDAILENVWGYDVEVETNVVDVYIRHLRKKLPVKLLSIIETVIGVGYVMRNEQIGHYNKNGHMLGDFHIFKFSYDVYYIIFFSF